MIEQRPDREAFAWKVECFRKGQTWTGQARTRPAAQRAVLAQAHSLGRPGFKAMLVTLIHHDLGTGRQLLFNAHVSFDGQSIVWEAVPALPAC